MLQKQDFITLLAQKGYTKKAADVIVDDFLTTVAEILVSGESVMFRGFGVFEVREHAERESIDPQTKERFTLPSFRAPKFTAGKILKRAVREGILRD